MLLLNRETHAEAIWELRKLPLDLSGVVNDVLRTRKLDLLDLISIATLRKISHIHLGANSEYRDVQILWGGLRLYKEPYKVPHFDWFPGARTSDAKWQLKTLSKECKLTKQTLVLDVQEKVLVSSPRLWRLTTDRMAKGCT